MRLLPTLYLALLLFSITNSFSQITIITKLPDSTVTVKKKDSPETIITKRDSVVPSNWIKKNMLGIDISQIAFVNWSAGGTSAVSGLLKGHLKRDYKDDYQVWSSELIFRYGLNKQEGVELRKTDDVFRLNSTYGYRKDTLSNWYHSAKFNFNTQFTPGYNYPNTENPISKPFAPAYTFLGIGSEYINKVEKFKFYISPLTLKNTLVLDQTLANLGAYGVTKAVYDVDGNMISEGKQSKTELGILMTTSIEKEIFTNITLKSRLSLYTDYLNDFGNIDVDWQFQLDLKVNQYVQANVGLNLLYDDEIDTIKDENGVLVNTGPKVQLKQVLGVGLEYNF
jgi:hypothetical protein